MIRSVIPPALLLLAACSNQPVDTPPPEFGAAVRQNMAAHILPVEAATDAPEPTGLAGMRANIGMDRYMKDAVTPPPRNTSGGGGSSQQGGK